MQAFLMPNLDKEHAPYCTKTSASILAACGVSVLIEPQFSALVNSGDVSFVSAEEGLLRCDMLIAIGGDGTAPKPLCGTTSRCSASMRAGSVL